MPQSPPVSSGSTTASVNEELVADIIIAAASPLAGPTPVVAPGGTVAGRATLASPKLNSSTAGKPCNASHSSSSCSSARVSPGPAANFHGTAGEVIALCVLYIFAGEERQADVRHFLEALQFSWGFVLFLKEVDLLRGREMDVSDEDASMEYRGPLPHTCPLGGHRYKLIGKAKGGGFRISPSASFPPEMCRWLALLIVRSFFGCETLKEGLGTSNRGVFSKVLPAQVTIEEPLSEDDESQKVEAASDGCQNLGPPLNTFWDGRRSEFSDGFGLCSLGRWRPFKRGLEMSAEATSFCKSLSDVIDKHMGIMFKDPQKMVISLALGKIKAQPFSDQQVANLRKDWFNLLPDTNQAAVVPVHQPFLLHAMSQTLRCMEDPDWRVLSETVDSYASGCLLAWAWICLGPLRFSPEKRDGGNTTTRSWSSRCQITNQQRRQAMLFRSSLKQRRKTA